ncbi:hypothetical protein GLOTRDRAFT_136211 [Gloeophyllum trabeum ATCC 11539]|uniref:Vacuolar ATPase assembly integral membrane protein VMA21 n=1 Tax=Gloeophyllum trabeum (strain ATCC 11539 / FP-39264 / Madison 617) TaxID=670483 RepID=S7RWM9_GLOTA|nr:uncharacterized protein GLOTRDRAFT_136211 [Gloeophyllum trabeum ATCC 11539]EPQ59310.1 hypothetical protein GLOTRDRAFT_136211 [Gloeophyllum trabeum ATCC 11539]
MSEQAKPANITDQAAKGGVLTKLILFSLSLGIIPISSYFLSERYVWNGNSNYAAITAVFAANVVLVTYIILSILEDKSPASVPPDVPKDTKKKQ